ncbi:MAG: hypothetical protein EXS58_17870, partial [Candidatus Latescibacteria bacterium]|nr:hypothetical protein [Candidatus Latescibacterota bacterium]
MRNPQIGQKLDLTVSVNGTHLVKGYAVKIQYDPQYFTFLEYHPGNLVTGAIPLSSSAPIANGMNQAEGGGTLLGRSAQAKTSGTLGSFFFQVTGQVPTTGTYVSIVSVEVNTSATDKDILVFAPGTFGFKASYIFPNALFDFTTERFQD